MNRIRKELLKISVILFFLGIGIYNAQEAKAAVIGSGTVEDPFQSDGRSIEKYMFDEYNGRDKVESFYNVYKRYSRESDTNPNADAPYYIRLGDTAELRKGNPDLIPLNAEDSPKGEGDAEDDKNPLYVMWVSKLKRAGGSGIGNLAECTDNSTDKIEPRAKGGDSAVYYYTFGFGLRSSKWEGSFESSAPLGEDASAFVRYTGCKNVRDHKYALATYEQSPDIGCFWMYTSGGQLGYVVYYLKYSKAWKFVNDYNIAAAPGTAIAKAQSMSAKSSGYEKYDTYNLYLNGAVAKHSSSGWTDTATTWIENKNNFSGLAAINYENYKKDNYNKHITLHVIKQVPIVVRAWDVTTSTHTTDIQHEGERLEEMVASIREHGVLNLVIVLQSDDEYEMLSGHNRANAAKLAVLVERYNKILYQRNREDIIRELSILEGIEDNCGHSDNRANRRMSYIIATNAWRSAWEEYIPMLCQVFLAEITAPLK